MSINIYMVINTGLEDTSVYDVGNYTHNCQRMWTLALNASGFKPTALIAFWAEHDSLDLCLMDGMKASDAYPILEKAVSHMDNPENRATYEAMNPANGWGDFKSAREYLRKLAVACRDYPSCTIRTSC